MSALFSDLSVSVPIAKLAAMTKLPAGWRYGNGGAITEKIASTAINWMSHLAFLGFKGFKISPLDDGVFLEAKAAHGILELSLFADGSISVLSDGNGNITELSDLTGPDAARGVTDIARKLCATFDSLIQDTGTSTKAVSRAPLFASPQNNTVAEFPLLWNNARYNQAVRSATTYGDITYRPLEIRPSSLYSITQNSRAIAA